MRRREKVEAEARPKVRASYIGTVNGFSRSVRRQKTVELSGQDKKSIGYSVKNLFYHARLIKRAKQWVMRTSSAFRFRHISVSALKKINDKCYDFLSGSRVTTSQLSENEPHFTLPTEAYSIDGDGYSSEEDNEDMEPTIREGLFVRQLTRSKTKNIHRNRNSSFSSRIFAFLNTLLQTIPISNPNDSFKLVWDTLLCLVVIIMSIITPMELALQEFYLQYFIGLSSGLALVLFICIADVFVSLNTAFFSRGKIEERRLEILKAYFLRQSGMYDILIVQGLVFEYANSGSEMIRLNTNWNIFEYTQTILLVVLFYVKVMRLQRYAFKIEEMFALKRRSLQTL